MIATTEPSMTLSPAPLQFPADFPSLPGFGALPDFPG